MSKSGAGLPTFAKVVPVVVSVAVPVAVAIIIFLSPYVIFNAEAAENAEEDNCSIKFLCVPRDLCV
jgi:hypothetical protein